MSAAMTLDVGPISLPLSAHRLASLGFVLILMLLLWAGLHDMPQSPVRFVGVEGQLSHVKADEVLARVRPVSGAGFLQLNLDEVRASVETLPWVAYARVERQWPARLQIKVWERTAYARWGESSLVDTGGRRYSPPVAQFPAGLPLLEGPEGREYEVMDAYSKFSNALADTPFAIAALRMDVRGEWTATTRSGLELRLGRDLPVLKADLIRTDISSALAHRLQEVLYVDLRYTNGFSVGWKPVTATPTVGVNNG